MNMADMMHILDRLDDAFPDIEFDPSPLLDRGEPHEDDQVCVRVPADRLLEVMSFLHDDDDCRFDLLADVTCVDYLEFPDATDRYGVTYNLVSTIHNHRFWVKCFANDPNPSVPSVVGIWHGANWPEREVWDLYGVKFEGHPDLRRLVTWEGFEAHPLRKDYPLQGRGERDSLFVLKREES